MNNKSPCPTCDGTGYYTDSDTYYFHQTEYVCPRCCGSGEVTKMDDFEEATQ